MDTIKDNENITTILPEEDVAAEPYEDEYEAPAPREKKPAGKRPASKKKTPPPQKRRRKKKKKKKKSPVALAVFLTLLFLCLAAAGAAGYFVYRTSQLDTVYPGVQALGTDFSGMTKEQVNDALMARGAERFEELSVTAELPLENSLTITAQEAGLRWNADALTEEIWSYGRGGSALENTLTYVKAAYLGENSFTAAEDLAVSLDEDAVRAIIDRTAEDIDEQLLESGVEITDSEIRLTKGASGLTLDKELLFENFTRALLAGDDSGFTYESVPQPDEDYDFQSLHDDLYSPMVNARIVYAPEYAAQYESLAEAPENPEFINYAWGSDQVDRKTLPTIYRPALTDPQPGDENLDFGGQPFLVTESSIGVDFDVAAAEAAWAAAGYGDTVTVPLTVTQPELSTEEINSRLFADPLSKNWTMVRLLRRDYCDEVRTSLAGSSKNRISNVKKACELLDGIMLMPGETFSYNDTLGERIPENGWLPAPAYADGEVRQENGGGICQVSSTLYNAVAYSNLRVLERECHQFQVGYLPAGMDATVSWGWPDFRFMNTKLYPIKIHAWVDDKTNECCVQILGTDYEHVYVIMKFSQGKVYDTTGEHVDENGNSKAVGTDAATWRVIYRDGDDWSAGGKPLSEAYEYYSKYKYHSEDI